VLYLLTFSSAINKFMESYWTLQVRSGIICVEHDDFLQKKWMTMDPPQYKLYRSRKKMTRRKAFRAYLKYCRSFGRGEFDPVLQLKREI
jgi:hypothetical protein